MPAATFSSEEIVIALYFASYGVKNHAIANILNSRRLSLTRQRDANDIWRVLDPLKSYHDEYYRYLYDCGWNRKHVGLHLAKIMPDSRRFDQLTHFGWEEHETVRWVGFLMYAFVVSDN